VFAHLKCHIGVCIIEITDEIGGDYVAKELSFETFLDAHRADFSEYLSRASTSARSENRYAELTEKLQRHYADYPKIAGIIDTEKPCELSEQECVTLIEILLIKNELAGLELEQVYFKGCADSVGYLKKMNML